MGPFSTLIINFTLIMIINHTAWMAKIVSITFYGEYVFRVTILYSYARVHVHIMLVDIILIKI